MSKSNNTTTTNNKSTTTVDDLPKIITAWELLLKNLKSSLEQRLDTIIEAVTELSDTEEEEQSQYIVDSDEENYSTKRKRKF